MTRASLAHLARFTAPVILFALAACGKTSSSPIAPSSISVQPGVGTTTTATINGQVTTGSSTGLRTAAVVGGLSVTVVGTSITASVDNLGHFSLSGVPAGNVDLQFSAPSVNVRVSVGNVAERERVELEIQIEANNGSIVTNEHVSPDDHAEIEGRIGSVDDSAQSVHVGSAEIHVSSSTTLHSGSNTLTFRDLKAQQHVHVRGTASGNVVSAQDIEVEDQVEPEPEPGDPNETEFSGAIGSVSGSCPALTLNVAGQTVTTSGATTFDKAACGDLRTGMTVEVKGTKGSSGVVAASRIQVDDAGKPGDPTPDPETEFTGTVASVGNSCPSISMSVAGRNVVTSGSTDFQGGSCSNIQPGVTVEVSGTVAGNGVVSASRVKIDK